MTIVSSSSASLRGILRKGDDITVMPSGFTSKIKSINLYDTATSVRGTEQSTVGTTVPQIGRAKSRGFETVSATNTDDISPAKAEESKESTVVSDSEGEEE